MSGPIDPLAPSSANLARRRRAALAAGVALVAVSAVAAFALRPGGDRDPSLLPTRSAPTGTSATPSATSVASPPSASSAPAASRTPPPGGTHVVDYTPYRADGSLAPGVDVVSDARGTCRAGFLSRDDAFRCVVDGGQNQYDPCFRSPRDAAELVCPRSPRGDGAVRIRQARFDDTNREPDHGDGAAWYLELVDGRRCKLLGGATTTYDGMRANYECPNGGVLFGDPDRSTGRWTIHYAKSFRPRSRADVSVVGITRAWY